MHGDFERMTFDPTDAFANVLMQQGRLLLSADFNELGAILQHALRQFIVDLEGRVWQPEGKDGKNGKGFEIVPIAGTSLGFTIKGGPIYVDGIRCENPTDLVYGAAQPFWANPDPLGGLDDLAIIYLHCWERHVTWLQNGKLREVALGGPDTATRVQVAWQVRAEAAALAHELSAIGEALKEQLDASPGKDKALSAHVKRVEELTALFANGTMKVDKAELVLQEIDTAAPARMAADAKQDVASPDPCAIASDAEYRGRENQLYRVEVHDPGIAQHATIKWSRENGSVAFRLLDAVVDEEGTHVTLESLGHDRRTGVSEGDWVEMSDDDLEVSWTTAPLLQVRKIDVQRRVVTLNGKAAKQPNPERHAILRRWDHRANSQSKGVVAVVEAKGNASWMELERGIKIRFESGGYYRKGDYWLIPARVATGDIEWPMTGNVPKAIEPHGITHHRAVLALLIKSGGTWKDA